MEQTVAGSLIWRSRELFCRRCLTACQLVKTWHLKDKLLNFHHLRTWTALCCEKKSCFLLFLSLSRVSFFLFVVLWPGGYKSVVSCSVLRATAAVDESKVGEQLLDSTSTVIFLVLLVKAPRQERYRYQAGTGRSIGIDQDQVCSTILSDNCYTLYSCQRKQ